jgi:hypothetical protein
MKIARAAVFALSIVPAALAFGTARDAHACGMSVRLDPTPQRPTPVQEIARAEKALESGQNAQAARAVLGTFPRVRAVTAGQNPLETRALRVFALAVVRSDGSISERSIAVPAAKPAADGTEWTPAANLAWAVEALREIDGKRSNDPTVQADLGEALSKTAHGQAEALRILQGLAQRDLMGSPHAYAALAKLRSQLGDQSGAEAAIKRCEEMSRSPGLCRPTAPAAKPAVAAKA